MSQELNETTHQNTPGDNNNQPKRRNNTLIYAAIIAALLGVNIYLFMSKNKVSTQRDEAYSQLDTVSTDRDNMRMEYDAALARLDMMVGKNAELDSLVSGKDSEIGRLKSQIQSILSNSRANASDLSRARTLITQLNRKVKSYEERIAELEGENTRLSEYSQTITKERDSTVTTNIALAQKVRLGAVLHASNIRMIPLDLRRSGKVEKETGKAKKVDVLRVSFDIDENRIAENGIKDLYLRIMGPNGSLLSNAAYGSGVTSTFDGQTLNYTMAKQVSLTQGQPVSNISLDWRQESDYARGDYQIEIYNEGYKIGGGKVHLK
jgi:outer membrane murein-binding lipoprotein Lpp